MYRYMAIIDVFTSAGAERSARYPSVCACVNQGGAAHLHLYSFMAIRTSAPLHISPEITHDKLTPL